jgi:hypothetical protein
MANPDSEALCRVRLGVPAVLLPLLGTACGGSSPGATATGPEAAPTTIAAVSAGTATLRWTAVTQNSDGTVLTDLAGYKVFYGVSADALNTIVVLSDPNVTTYEVANLAPGTWYFAVAAYTASGTQGELSDVAVKTVN